MPLLRFRREAENGLGEKEEKDERRSDAFLELKNKSKRGISSVAAGGGIWAFLPSPFQRTRHSLTIDQDHKVQMQIITFLIAREV